MRLMLLARLLLRRRRWLRLRLLEWLLRRRRWLRLMLLARLLLLAAHVLDCQTARKLCHGLGVESNRRDGALQQHAIRLALLPLLSRSIRELQDSVSGCERLRALGQAPSQQALHAPK